MLLNHDTSRDVVNGFLSGENRKDLLHFFEEHKGVLDIQKSDEDGVYKVDMIIGEERFPLSDMTRDTLLMSNGNEEYKRGIIEMFQSETGKVLAEGTEHSAEWWTEHYKHTLTSDEMKDFLDKVDKGYDLQCSSEINIDNFDYASETNRLLQGMSKENKDRIFLYEMCELDPEFVGFLHSYEDLRHLPKDFTIIDIGANHATQSEYFKDFAEYIAVEPCVPEENVVHQLNSTIYTMTGQEFIEKVLPVLRENGLDLNKTFCVSSYVPDEELRDRLIPETFPNYRCTYAGCVTHERMPVSEKENIREKRKADIIKE